MKTDTGDRRANRVAKNRVAAAKSRKRYYENKAAGFCGHCGLTPVLGRAICFECTDKINDKRDRERGYGRYART